MPLIVASFFVTSANGPFTMIGGLITAGTAPNAVFVVGGLAVFAAQSCFLVLLYRAWRFTIDELKKQKLTPAVASAGKALGFAFIPGFNLYWLFVLFGRLMTEGNRLAAARGRDARLPSWLGFGIPPLLFLSLVTPFTGVPAFLVGVFAAYPLYISLVISFLSGLAGKAVPAKTVSAYHDLFGRKTFGPHIPFALAFFIAQVISIVSQTWLLALTENTPVMLVFHPIIIGNYFIFPLLFTAVWYTVSVFVKNDWPAAVLFGLAQIAFHLFSFDLVFLPFHLDLGIIAWMAWEFAAGFLPMPGFVLAARPAGARLGGFLLAPFASVLAGIVHRIILGAPYVYMWTVGGLVTALATGALLYGGLSRGMAYRKFMPVGKEIVRLVRRSDRSFIAARCGVFYCPPA